MNLRDLNPIKGDLVLIVRKNYVGLYQFEIMKEGYPFGRSGFELKKPTKIGKIELPLFIPLERQEDDLIIIPHANTIYLGLDEIISGLEVHKGYELHAAIMRYARDRPMRRPRR